MNRPTVKITKPDGSTKIIVGKSSDNQYVKTATEPVKSREPIKEKKPKLMHLIGLMMKYILFIRIINQYQVIIIFMILKLRLI